MLKNCLNTPIRGAQLWIQLTQSLVGRIGFLALLVVLGAVSSLGFFPDALPLITGLGVAFLFYFWTLAKSPRLAALMGWLFGVGYFSVGLYWLHYSIFVYGGLPWGVSVAAVVLLAMFLAVVPAVTGYVARWIQGSPFTSLAVVSPLLWTISEWVRGEWMGFGWLSVSYAWVQELIANLAPLVGVYGVTAVILMMCGGLLALTLVSNSQQIMMRSSCVLWLGILAFAGVIFDGYRWSRDIDPIEVRLVQPALPIEQRMTSEKLNQRVQRLQAMSERAPLGYGLDLIVWPESAPGEIIRSDRESVSHQHASAVSRIHSAAVIYNGFEKDRGAYYNSLWMANDRTGEREHIYRKSHLVPFGEFVPAGFRWFVDWIGIPMADLGRGTPQGNALVEVASTNIGMTICYENLFGSELRHYWRDGSTGPGVMLNVANLSWFAPEVRDQFLQMTAMRAREMSRPWLQSLNDASSALVLPTGRIDRQAKAGPQNLDVAVIPQAGKATPFMQWGNAIWLWLAILVLALAFWQRGRSRGN